MPHSEQQLSIKFMKYNFFMNSALNQAWSRNHNTINFHQLFEKLLEKRRGGGGGAHSVHFCKLFVP